MQWKNFSTKEPITYLSNYSQLTYYVPNGQICLECGADFQEDNHIRGQIGCIKCKYQSACLRAVLDHVAVCNGAVPETMIPAPAPLGQEMFCICGFTCSDGNDLARHLASCERKSAYATAELAQQNTVKCNMLDMLGLVRRDGEDEEDSNEGLLIPADQQQPLPSKSADRVEEGNDRGEVVSDQAADVPAADFPAADVPAAAANEASATDDVGGNGPAAAPAEDFNTQLSLDDLAPQSVAPPIEHDRTPQLSDEYQVWCPMLQLLPMSSTIKSTSFVFIFRYRAWLHRAFRNIQRNTIKMNTETRIKFNDNEN